ncbi:dTDP-4-dehydrorhamnose 3,5-epimerase family protein [Rhizobium sp. SG2393]|uniref:dTDP-4-dehydrorhamnose 3,5-epimerase family protein n=1 Tax=Rhizobium sp. SG2393 TaxID=3276279 RepID=UPI00366D5326
MSGRFTPLETPIAGLQLLERRRIGDDRGFFSRVFCVEDLAPFGWDGPAVQINESLTRIQGTVRGLHYQNPPFAEQKLVTCVAGRVLDVAVDIRRGSPTFLKSFATELSAENGRSLLVPRGFAHGFQALSPDAHLVYAVSAAYAADAEAALHCLDPAIGIAWPLPVVNLSPRDSGHAFITGSFEGVAL